MASSVLFAVNAVLNLTLMLALARILPADSYGALSVWTAAALFVATTAFDWVRYSALRFYTPRARAEDPAVRASLDTGFALAAVPALVLIAAVAWLGLLPGLDVATAAALAGLCVGNAATEYLAALARARFDTRIYARLVLFRHVLTIGIVVPTAWITGSAPLTLAALAAAVWPSVAVALVALRDRDARARLARAADYRRYAIYGLPVIAAEALFQAMILVNRAWLAAKVDLVAAGAYALTFDLAFKVLAVTASVCEASLFPRLVARHEVEGEAASREGLTRAVAVMLLLIVPVCVGYWWFAAAFSALVVAPEFRAAFVAGTGAALVGGCLYIMQTYLFRPAFQIELRTLPLLQAAALAFVVNGATLLLHPAQGLSTVVTAHVAGLGAGFVLMAVHCLAGRRLAWPVVDSMKIAAAAALMIAVAHVLPDVDGAPLLTILGEAAAMGLAFVLAAALLDAAGARSYFVTLMRSRAARSAG